jgi:hypothetical protein
MATTSDLQTRITDAEAALHLLAMGQQVVAIKSPNGVDVQYQGGDMDKLQRYIAWLKSQLQSAQSGVSDISTNRRPITFSFGR